MALLKKELASREGQNDIADAIREITRGVLDIERAEAAADAAETSADAASTSADAASTSAADAANSAAVTQALHDAISGQYGYPFTAPTADAMTDTTKIYVYTGSEAGYTNGNWYYNDGNAWVSGGVFNSIESDVTAEMSLFGINDLLWDNTNPSNNTQNGVTYTVDTINKSITISSGGSPSTGASVLNFLLSTSPFPAWLQKQKKYIAHLDTETDLRFEVYQKRSGGTALLLAYADKTQKCVEFEFANDAVAVGIRLYLGNGKTINTVAKPFISEATLSTNELEQEIEFGLGSSPLELHHGYIDASDNNLWKTGYGTHAIFPVKGGETIVAIGNGATGSVLAMLKTYNCESGIVADLSDDANWNTPIILGANKVYESMIPSDTNYLYVYYRDENNYRYPRELLIDGYNIFNTISVTTQEMAQNFYKEIKSQILINKGYIDDDHWTVPGISVDRNHMVCPVKGGETITITAQDSASSSIAVLKSYSTPVNGETVDYSSDPEWTDIKLVLAKETSQYTLPADARFIYSYYNNLDQIRYPKALLINGYDVMKSVKENFADIRNSSKAVKVRIMQYNVGKFNYGSQTPGIPSEMYAEKVQAYKEFLCKYHPDIIGIQEFVQYIDADQTQLTNDVLFNQLYPYADNVFAWERAIKSKYPLKAIHTITLTYVDPDDQDETVRYAACVFAKVYVDGKIVDVITTALPSYANVRDYNARATLFPQVLALMDNVNASEYGNSDYKFIVLDMNNGGNGNDVSATQEGEELLQIAKDAGWNFANGGYLPFKKTYLDPEHRPDLFLPIDNVVYKDNGKVIFNNFQVLYDDYENLTSDHVPTYAEFVLL